MRQNETAVRHGANNRCLYALQLEECLLNDTERQEQGVHQERLIEKSFNYEGMTLF